MSSWVNKLLKEHTTARYYIEYMDFRINHISHGVVALDRLGASEERVKRFIKVYTKQLDEPSGEGHTDEHPDAAPIRQEDIDGTTGKRKGYYAILNYYAKKFNDGDGDVDAFVKREFPPLALGMQTGLLHGMIMLGYGCASKETTAILEALALLRHSYRPIVFKEDAESNDIKKFGQGDTDLVDVLYELKQDDELYNYMVKREKEMEATDWVTSWIQRQICAYCEKGDKLIGYANKIKVPRDVLRDPLHIADWLIDQALIVYTTAQADRSNDFVLLHGVTCAWSVRQVLPILATKDALEALRALVCVVFSAYLGVGGPRLTNLVDSSIHVDAATWEELIKRTVDDDVDRDEHVYKLLQVCYEQWKKAESGPNAALYYTAARKVIDNPFAPFEPSKPRL